MTWLAKFAQRRLPALAVWLAPAPQPKAAAAAPVTFAEVQAVIAQRCTLCHNDRP